MHRDTNQAVAKTNQKLSEAAQSLRDTHERFNKRVDEFRDLGTKAARALAQGGDMHSRFAAVQPWHRQARGQAQQVTVNTTYHVNETHSADATAKRIRHMHNRDMAHLINHNRPMVA